MKYTSGYKFGCLELLYSIPSVNGAATKYQCLCECGNLTKITGSNIKRTKSCGCRQHLFKDAAAYSVINKRFGRLVAIERLTPLPRPATPRSRKMVKYKCVCDCGTFTEVTYTNLMSGGTQSCGCWQKESASIRTRKALGTSATTSVWNYYKRNAAVRSYEWALTREQFELLIFSNCKFCGTSPLTLTKMKYGDFIYNNGIDRLNNALGYTVGNVVSCCKICNIAKHTMAVGEFTAWVDKIYLHLHKGGDS